MNGFFWIQIWRQNFSGWLSFADDLLRGLSQRKRVCSSESESSQIGGLLVKASTGLCQRVRNEVAGFCSSG